MIANSNIIETAKKNKELKGMGTKVVSMLVNGGKVYPTRVGDSRIYQLRDNKLTQMTADHSMLNEDLERRKMTEEEIRSKDYYLLCSDGLTDLVSDQEIQQTMIDCGNDC